MNIYTNIYVYNISLYKYICIQNGPKLKFKYYITKQKN